MELTAYARWNFNWSDEADELRISFVRRRAGQRRPMVFVFKRYSGIVGNRFELTPEGIPSERYFRGSHLRLDLKQDPQAIGRHLIPLSTAETGRVLEFYGFFNALDEAIRCSRQTSDELRRIEPDDPTLRPHVLPRADMRLSAPFAFCFAPEIGASFHFLDDCLTLHLDRYHAAYLNYAACERVWAVAVGRVPYQLACVRPFGMRSDCFCYGCVARIFLISQQGEAWLCACLRLFLNFRGFARANISDADKAAHGAAYALDGLFGDGL